MAPAPSTPIRLKYVNPYSGIGPKYSAGLDSIVSVLGPLYPDQTIDDLVNAVYAYVTATYTMTPDPLEEQNIKSVIYALINGYLNYNLAYSPQQTAFINELIAGTLACGNPEDIRQHILDVEAAIAESGLTITEQAPLLYAIAVGKAAYIYWAAIVTTPGSWADFVTSFTPAIVKFPYWVAASMQGVLIGINTLNTLDAQVENTFKAVIQMQGFEILLALYGSLAVGSGKVVFNLQQTEIDKSSLICKPIVCPTPTGKYLDLSKDQMIPGGITDEMLPKYLSMGYELRTLYTDKYAKGIIFINSQGVTYAADGWVKKGTEYLIKCGGDVFLRPCGNPNEGNWWD